LKVITLLDHSFTDAPMKFLLLTTLTFISFVIYGQTEATTTDGKKVFLYKNGTWKFAKNVGGKKSVKAESKNVDVKKEAFDFSMQLVQSYFSQDCSVLQRALPNEIFTMKGVTTLTDEMRAKICQLVNSAITDKSKTIDDYVANYQIVLLSRAEVEVKAGTTLPIHFDSTPNEFYFLGFERKTSATAADFIEVRLFVLLIRKVNNTWQVKGFLND
jgi:hypothetical protein